MCNHTAVRCVTMSATIGAPVVLKYDMNTNARLSCFVAELLRSFCMQFHVTTVTLISHAKVIPSTKCICTDKLLCIRRGMSHCADGKGRRETTGRSG